MRDDPTWPCPMSGQVEVVEVDSRVTFGHSSPESSDRLVIAVNDSVCGHPNSKSRDLGSKDYD